MNTQQRKVMEQALEALTQYAPLNSIEAITYDEKRNFAITALRAALADAYENEAWNAYDRAMEEPVANIGCLGMPVNTPVTAPQPAIPPGYKLVPVEPTPKMKAVPTWGYYSAFRTASEVWADMLAAAPEAPQTAKRVPLTNTEVDYLLDALGIIGPYDFARAVIAAYERKNGITGGTK